MRVRFKRVKEFVSFTNDLEKPYYLAVIRDKIMYIVFDKAQ